MINDSLGHAIGDKALIDIAGRLRACLRAGDLLARFGGDEFTILIDDIKSANEATEIAQRVHGALADPLEAGEQEIVMTASIGIAFSDAGYKSPDEVLRDADTAMYRAKATGKSRHTVFQTHMRRKVQNYLQMDQALRRSIKDGDFPIFYQPIIDLKTGHLAGFEANVRWLHPERGLINPDEFIPLAEETGAIATLGLIVLRDACRQAVYWQKHFPKQPPLTMAVNFSARQFVQADLIDAIAAVVIDTEIDPRTLVIEITESAVMERPEFAIQML
jgi:diguanylate cyclase (GGDEF)-like protein